MADNDVKRLLERLLADIPLEMAPGETRPEKAVVADTSPEALARLERHAIHLQTASQVSRAASSILDLDELLPQAVDLIRRQFGFYYVGIFLVEAGEWAVLQSGTDEAGQRMVEQGHRLQVGGDSMIGWCIAHRQARIALDVGEEAVHFDNPLLPDTRSEMALPLISRDQVIGAMTVQSTEAAAFSEEDVAVLQSMADQLANAIENARLYAEAKQRTAELSALLEVSTAASSALSLDDVLAITAEQIVTATNSDGCTLSRWDRLTDSVVTWIEVRLDDREADEPGSTYALEDYPATRAVLESREPAIILATDPDADATEVALMREQGVSALLMLPLIAGEEVIGLVEVEQSSRARRFVPAEIRLCQALAHHAADAIEDARLAQERERRITELAMVNEIGQAVSSTLDLDAFLTTVHRQVSRLFDTTNFYIATYEEGSDQWTSVFRLEGGERQPIARHSIEAGLTGHIIRTHEPLLFRTHQESAAFQQAEGAKIIGEIACSWLGVPVISADRLVGVMAIQNYEQEYVYGEQDLTLFSTIAAQVANALENLRLLDETRRRAREMEAINEVGQAITSVLDVDAVLRQIVDITKARFGHYCVNIALVEGSQLVFRYGSTIGSSERRLRSAGLALDLKGGSGLTVEAVRSGRPLLVNDVLADPRYLPVAELEDTRSELAVPIEVKGRIIGVLDVQSDRPFAYRQADVALLQSLVNQAGIAIENARLFQDRERRITDLAIVNEIGRAVSVASEMEDLLEIVYGRLTRLFETTSFYVAVYDEASGEWTVALEVERGERQPEGRYKADTGLTGYIIRSRQPLLLRTLVDFVAFSEAKGIDYLGEPARSWLGVPLIAADEVVGVMAIQDYDRENSYDEQAMALFSTIAAQVANALENVRLLTQTRDRAEEMLVLNEMGRALNVRLDVDAVLYNLYRYASQLMDTTNFYVSLYDPEADLISFPLAVENKQQVQWGARHSGRGLTEYVVRSGEPLLIAENVRETIEQRLEGVEHIGQTAESWLGVPMTIIDQVIGVVAVQSYDTARLYNERHRDLLVAMARQAAIAIENARLFAQEEQSVQRAQALYETSRALSSHLEEEPLIRAILEAVYRTLGCEHVTISTVDEEAGVIEARHIIWQGEFDVFPEWIQMVRYPLDHPDITAEICRTGRTEIIGEWDERFNQEIWDKFGHERLLRIFMPIRLRERVIGVIEVGYDKEKKEAIDEEEVQLLAAFVDQAATALQNARLFEEEQRARRMMDLRINQLACLNDIGRKIDEGPSIAEFLAWVAGRVPSAMQYPDNCRVCIEFQDRVYGAAEALALPVQMVHSFRIGDVAMGRVCIAYHQDGDFLDEESALLGDITRRVGGYIENRRLLQQTEARAEELAVINEMGRTFAMLPARDTVIESVYRYASRLMDTTNFYAALYDREHDQVIFPLYIEGKEVRRNLEGRRGGKGMTEYVIHSGKPLLAEDNVTQRLAALGIELIGTESESWLGVPMMIGGEVLGVIAVQSYTTPGLYSEHHRDLLGTIASQAAVALENIRLLEQARERAERERLARTISDRVRHASDREAVMRLALQELSQMLGASQAVVRLGTRKDLLLEQEEPANLEQAPN
jgi:GAF domain-containing protein